MNAKILAGLLKKGDRVAVSNITGREASKVSVISQAYANNIVGGWALGKGKRSMDVPKGDGIPVFPTCAKLYQNLPKNKLPNKVIIYSPPTAVYGEVKEVLAHGGAELKTLFVITEHVSIEVTAKIHNLCKEAGVDVIGCNTLGVINTHDHVRVGAVGGDMPEESFVKGSATIISNSGNMVNTMATYMLTGGMGTHMGISTGKDMLILTPMVELLKLAAASKETRMIVLYVEPGGVYEKEAIDWMKKCKFKKPVIVYVAGQLTEGRDVSLGHAGAVVEGKDSSASGKMAMFDKYFRTEAFDPEKKYRADAALASKLRKGMRVTTLHHLPEAAKLICRALKMKPDFPVKKQLNLNPWFSNFRGLAKSMPSELRIDHSEIPEPYATQFAKYMKESVGLMPAKRKMKNASHASSLVGEARIYGYSITQLMEKKSLGDALILYWTGDLPKYRFESKLVEMSLLAALTNGPGTISAQGAKLSASAGNSPHTAMIATLASIGDTHGGNGRQGVKFMLDVFKGTDLKDPYAKNCGVDPKSLAQETARNFKKMKDASKESGVDYKRIPCLGHPVFNRDPINYDPRERAISKAIKDAGKRNVFLDFYHELAKGLRDVGAAGKIWAVNMDAALAAIWLGICWEPLMEKRVTQKRVEECAFLGFALGRVAGGAGEFLDHQDFNTAMDMRTPASDCVALTRPRELE